MDSLRKKIKANCDENVQNKIDSLDVADLRYLEDKLKELNSSGRDHIITKIERDKDKIDLDFKYSVSYCRRD